MSDHWLDDLNKPSRLTRRQLGWAAFWCFAVFAVLLAIFLAVNV